MQISPTTVSVGRAYLHCTQTAQPKYEFHVQYGSAYLHCTQTAQPKYEFHVQYGSATRCIQYLLLILKLYVTMYVEIGHLSAKFILRYKPKQLKQKVLANFLSLGLYCLIGILELCQKV